MLYAFGSCHVPWNVPYAFDRCHMWLTSVMCLWLMPCSLDKCHLLMTNVICLWQIPLFLWQVPSAFDRCHCGWQMPWPFDRCYVWFTSAIYFLSDVICGWHMPCTFDRCHVPLIGATSIWQESCAFSDQQRMIAITKMQILHKSKSLFLHK